MREQSAAVYVRQGKAFITAESKTAAGFWIESPPFFVEDGTAVEVIAERVLVALACSRTDIPTPPPSDLKSRVPRLAGVATFGTFMKGALAVDIAASAHDIVVTPMRNGGTRRGFEYMESGVQIVGREASALAGALARALENAE